MKTKVLLVIGGVGLAVASSVVTLYALDALGPSDGGAQIGGPWASPQQGAMSTGVDWKLFSNSTYGFSVEYPYNWKVVDLSTGAGGNRNIVVRVLSPSNTNVQGFEGQPVLLDILICYSDLYQRFTDHCDGTNNESVTLEHPYQRGDQDINPLDVSLKVIQGAPEYATARQILGSAKLLSTPDLQFNR